MSGVALRDVNAKCRAVIWIARSHRTHSATDSPCVTRVNGSGQRAVACEIKHFIPSTITSCTVSSMSMPMPRCFNIHQASMYPSRCVCRVVCLDAIVDASALTRQGQASYSHVPQATLSHRCLPPQVDLLPPHLQIVSTCPTNKRSNSPAQNLDKSVRVARPHPDRCGTSQIRGGKSKKEKLTIGPTTTTPAARATTVSIKLTLLNPLPRMSKLPLGATRVPNTSTP